MQAFPQPLYYNRLTGTFQEVEDDRQNTNNSSALASIGEAIPGSRHRHAVFAPGDEERERILEWAKTERLPLFLRSGSNLIGPNFKVLLTVEFCAYCQ